MCSPLSEDAAFANIFSEQQWEIKLPVFALE